MVGSGNKTLMTRNARIYPTERKKKKTAQGHKKQPLLHTLVEHRRGWKGRPALSIRYPKRWLLPDWSESIKEPESCTAISRLPSPVTATDV